MKVGVIGGSLAGLEFAKEAAEFCHVEVFEEDDEIGRPVQCAEGWLDTHGVGDPHPESIRNEVQEARLHFHGAPERHREVSMPVRGSAYVIDRSVNESLLAEESESLGAQVHTGQRRRVRGLSEEFDLVVDASGCPPQHLREQGVDDVEWSQGVQYSVEGDLSRYEDCFYLEFVEGLIGYYWIFPKSDTEANVGLGWSHGSRPDDPWGSLREFAERRLPDPQFEARTAGLIGTVPQKPLHEPGRNLAKIGDAAGLADPSNGEGMASAVYSARELADSLKNLDLPGYQGRVMEELGPQLFNGRLLNRVWAALDYDEFARMFNRLDGKDLEYFFEEPAGVRRTLLGGPVDTARVGYALARDAAGKLLD